MRKLNLRQLILLLTLSTAFLILANTFYTSYQTQRNLLIEQTLESNHAYAFKLAKNIENFLLRAQQQLSFAAQDIVDSDQSNAALMRVVERLITQSDSFNSVVIASANGTILAASETAADLLDMKLRSPGVLQALQERKPTISRAYQSKANASRALIFITHPVFDAQGNYSGFVGGTIYLQEKSVLYELLGEHLPVAGASVYAVSDEARLIYHPNMYRVGELVDDNPVVSQLVAKQIGRQQLTNTLGVEMLAGYAYVPSAGWGVVAQRTLDATLQGMDKQMLAVAKYSFPFFVIIVWFAWVISRWISSPLWQLASSAADLDEPDMDANISKISVWYFEASQLKRAMLRGLAGLNKKMGKLNLETITDPLTGLINRRGMQIALDEWERQEQPFSVIVADIDHFKRINDEFGHDVGDRVLQTLAQHMQAASRPDDLVCRSGGEEFVILLPQTETAVAHRVAERLRKRIAESICPNVNRPVTLSLGVASWPCGAASIAQVLKNADIALYAAKDAGRNQVQASQTACE